jgi:putative acyl-CoA dehydrogenase
VLRRPLESAQEAPLNGIWEGTGNVICLDVLRSIAREPPCVPALLDELREARGVDRRYDAFLDALESELLDLSRHEGQARRLVERIALAMSASLLIRHAPAVVADAFVATRLAGGWAGHFGDLPLGLDAGAIARRAVPAAA